jgi:phenylacetate-CoA ligase
VTGFRNLAMPLIRYDTGDLAEAVAGPCPCGRTLPAFGEIAGRFRRFVGLPPGTRLRVNTLIITFERIPPEELRFLRRYQIYQDRENRFELRVETAGPVPEAFREHFRRAWEPVAGDPPLPLRIVEVPGIPPGPGGKLLDFASELYEDAYANPSPAAG